MISSKAKVTYKDPIERTVIATFDKAVLATIAGVDPIKFPGTLQLLMANVGANAAAFYLTIGNKDVIPVFGMPLGATPSNPIIIPDLDPNTVLWYKSNVGTVIEIQVGKVSG